MCIIFICNKQRASLNLLKRGEAQNRDGAGIAWCKGGKVHWKKGIDAKEAYAIQEQVNLPVIIHFRMASAGGNDKALTHPFPVTNTVSVDKSGTTDRVLFHNGHWSGWDDKLMDEIISRGINVPDGPWSDSRTIALLVKNHGEHILSLIAVTSRFAMMSGNGEIKIWGKWEKDKDGILRSSTLYEGYGFEHFTNKQKGGDTKGTTKTRELPNFDSTWKDSHLQAKREQDEFRRDTGYEGD